MVRHTTAVNSERDGAAAGPSPIDNHSPPSDRPFFVCLILLSSSYLIIILAMLLADATFTTPSHFLASLKSPEIRYAIWLSLCSCTITTVASLWVAVPIGYLMSRYQFRGKVLVDAFLDIPIVLPPLVIGLSLLILFQTPVGRLFESVIKVTYEIPSVILAQFMVACAFAVRTMQVTFDQINKRQEQVALTLGCNHSQAFWMVIFPQARGGLLTAASLAWARSLGEFGPILIFSGATRMKTEVLPTSIFLELTVGNIEAAVAVSLLMVFSAVLVLIIVRVYGRQAPFGKLLRP